MIRVVTFIRFVDGCLLINQCRNQNGRSWWKEEKSWSTWVYTMRTRENNKIPGMMAQVFYTVTVDRD